MNNNEYSSELPPQIPGSASENPPEMYKLPHEIQLEILRVQGLGLGICSKCRWKSGCYKCDGTKARAFESEFVFENAGA